MYGVMTADGHLVVCSPTYQKSCVLSSWGYRDAGTPKIISDPLDADLFLQECIAHFNRYDLVIFEVTKEMEEQLIISRLKGY